MGSTLKGKNLLPLEQITSFKSCPISKGLHHLGSSRSNSAIFHFAAHSKMGSTLKGKNLLPWSKLLPLRVAPFREGFITWEAVGATLQFFILLLIQMGSTLKGKNLLPLEQITSFKSCPISKGLHHLGSSRSNSAIFHFAAHPKWGNPQRKEFAPLEQIISFKSCPNFGKASSPGKQTGNHKNYFPLFSIMEVYPFTLSVHKKQML